MRKMQVPAYEPLPVGVQAEANRGVVTAWKKTMAISDESMRMEDDDDMSMPSMLVDVDIALVMVMVMSDMPVEVAVAIVIPDMSIFAAAKNVVVLIWFDVLSCADAFFLSIQAVYSRWPY